MAAAPALLARHEPLTALARWLDRLADYAQVKRGVFGAVEAAVSQDLAAHSQVVLDGLRQRDQDQQRLP